MPPTRPSQYLDWTDGDPSKVIQPPSAQRLSGWVPGEPLIAQFDNWSTWLLDQWVQYLDGQQSLSQAYPALLRATRVINGGSWSFNASTGALSWSSAFNLAVPGIADADNQAAAGSVTLASGQAAYVLANIPLTVTGDTASGDNEVTNLSSEAGIVVGQAVTGAGIAGGTTVAAIAGDTVTLSANATATGSAVALTFSGSGALTVNVATEASIPVSPNVFVIARAVTLSSGLAVIAGMSTLLRDAESSLIDGQGYLTISTVLAGENLTQGQAVYLSAGVSDSRTPGAAYKLDCSVANGAKRSGYCGIVMTTTISGGNVPLVLAGSVPNFYTALTPGAVYYADPAVPGGKTTSVPLATGQYICPLGIATSATSFKVNPALASGVTVVTSINPWPQYSAINETQLSAALAGVSGGGVIVIAGSFSISASYIVPGAAILQGRKAASVITINAGGSLSVDAGGEIRDVNFATALTSGSLLNLSGNYAIARGCSFALVATGTGVGISVTGTGVRMYSNVFSGVSGTAAIGISYASGADNADMDSVFLP